MSIFNLGSKFKKQLSQISKAVNKAKNKSEKTSTTQTLKVVKNSDKFSSKLNTSLAVSKAAPTFSFKDFSNYSAKDKLTKDGAKESQQREEIEKKLDSIDRTTEEGQKELEKLVITRESDVLEDSYYDENEDFSYAAPFFEAPEGAKQLGPKENLLLEEEIPKIVSIGFYDEDGNGSFDSSVIVFKRLFARTSAKILFRELSYTILRKSIFEDKDYTPLVTIKAENFDQYKSIRITSLVLRNSSLNDEDNKYLEFKDKNVKPGQVYAYKISAEYDGNIDQPTGPVQYYTNPLTQDPRNIKRPNASSAADDLVSTGHISFKKETDISLKKK